MSCEKALHPTVLSGFTTRGGEWYLEKRGSRKILAGSRNLERVFDKSRSLVFAWFVFTLSESRNFLPRSLGLGFLTRISASRRVSDFTILHPYYCQCHCCLASGEGSAEKAVIIPFRMRIHDIRNTCWILYPWTSVL